MEWNNCVENTLCFHGQEEFEYREECNLMGFQIFRYINIELNFWIEWLEHVECFWSKFCWKNEASINRLDWVWLLKLIKLNGIFLETLVYEGSYSWKKSDNFFIEWFSKSSKVRHKEMMMESIPVVTVKIEFGHEINQL